MPGYLPGDYVKVGCAACGHVELLPPDKLRIRGLAVPPYTPVLDLEPRLRCRECDARGKKKRPTSRRERGPRL